MAIKVVTVGSEAKVNVTTTSDQMYPAISALADGGWVETWQSLTQDGGGFGVYQRRYDAQGVAVGGETLVNLVTADHQSSPSVAGLVNGGWVVTWQSNLQDGSGYGIYQRVYNAQGVSTGPDILVNATTANEQQNPSVTTLSDGGWVITWQSNLQDGSSNGIYLRRYTSAGTSSGSDTLVNVTTANDQSNSSITALKNGGWVVTWQSNLQDGSGYGIYQRVYNAQGVSTGPDILVNATTNLSQINPSIGALADGGWVVTWQSNLQDGSGHGIYQRIYNAQGVTTGPDILVNATTANEQQNPSVTTLSDGGWVVTWQSNLQDSSGYGVYQRYYTSSGTTVGPDILVNTSTGSDQQNPSVTALPNGGWVVSWMSHLQDGAGWGVYHRQYTANGAQILTANPEIATGTAADETLVVQPGSLNEGDQLMGGSGNDTLQMLSSGTIDLTAPAILSGFEVVAGSSGNDTLIVNAARFGAFTSFDGGAGADLLRFLGSGTYDTRGKTFAGIEKIVLSGGGAAITVDTVAIALLLRGSVEDHNSVTFAGGTFSAVERQQLFRQGIETIIDSSGTYTSQPPSLHGLNGDSARVDDGGTVLIDSGGDATVVDPMGSLRFLEVRVSQNGVSSEDRFGISIEHGVSLSGGVTPGSLVSVNGLIIGTITSAGYELQVAFNGSATGALIQQLVRSLTYTNINEVDPTGASRSISVTLTDSTGNWTAATTTVTVDRVNDSPTIKEVGAAAQSVADNALIAPFSSATVADVDSPLLTVTVTLDDPARGALLNLSGGSYDDQTGTYTLSGSAAEVTAALRALRFDPRDRPMALGQDETTTFTVSVSDDTSTVTTQNVSVISIVSNRAPTAITLSGTGIDEHAPKGAVIGTFGAVDPNGDQGFTYRLLDNADGRFAITDGKLVVVNPQLLAADRVETYSIQVMVTDAGGASYVHDFAITVGINHAPMAAPKGNAASGDEDTTITGKVPAGTDTDGDVLTYHLVTGVTGLNFAPDGSFSYAPEENFHGEITFQYQVMDRHGDLSQPQTFIVIVNPVGDAPVAGSSGNSASGNEGTTVSGKVPAGTDADGDTLRYQLVTDVEGLTLESDGRFSYVPAAGFYGEVRFQYRVVDSHNMESEPQTFTLNILDTTRPKDAVSTVVGEERGLNAAEATRNVAVIITPDEGARIVLAWINGMDLMLKDGIYSFDATKLQDGSHTIVVMTEDEAGNRTITTKNVMIDTTAPAAPELTLAVDTGVTGDLNTRNGTLTVSGIEAGSSVMYSTDGGRTWSSSFTATEGQNQIQVRQVDSAGNMSSILAFAFTLDTVAPSNISLSATSVSENAAAGTVIGVLSAADADASGFTYSLAPNGDADGRFMLLTLNGTISLVVKDGVKIDYEQATSHVVNIWVTDAAGNSSAKSFTIAVGDVRTENIAGSATSDVLKGGSGNDKINGGSGNDTLWGQSGKDVFVFDTKLGTSSSDRKVNFDTIKDFSVKDDGIWLDNAIFKKLGLGSPSKPKLLKSDFFKIGMATDKNDYVLYDKKTGVLSYDADGFGKGKAVEFAQLKKGLAPTHNDFFVI